MINNYASGCSGARAYDPRNSSTKRARNKKRRCGGRLFALCESRTTFERRQRGLLRFTSGDFRDQKVRCHHRASMAPVHSSLESARFPIPASWVRPAAEASAIAAMRADLFCSIAAVRSRPAIASRSACEGPAMASVVTAAPPAAAPPAVPPAAAPPAELGADVRTTFPALPAAAGVVLRCEAPSPFFELAPPPPRSRARLPLASAGASDRGAASERGAGARGDGASVLTPCVT